MTMEFPQCLREFPPFAGLEDRQLNLIAKLAVERHYRPNMFVLVEGEPVDAVFFLHSGSVKTTRSGADGREQIVSVLGPGDFFPHVGLLDGGPAPATVETLTKTDIHVIRREDFVALMRQEGELALRVLAALDRRIRILQTQVLDLGLKDVPARLASALLGVSYQFAGNEGAGTEAAGTKSADAGIVGTKLARTEIPSTGLTGAKPAVNSAPQTITLNVALSQQDLANMVGATRETVSRILADFRRAGIVTLGHGGQITIQDLPRLRRRAQGFVD